MGMILFISNILFYFTKNTSSVLHFWDWTIQFTISDVASMKKSYKLIFLQGWEIIVNKQLYCVSVYSVYEWNNQT